MALNGIQIFKLTPKKNCKECGCPTCMAFSMKVAQGAMKIEQCPHMSEDALASLSEATAPPMKTIKIGTGDGEFTLGGETVLFRHEKTFVSKTRYAVSLCTCMSDEEVEAKLAEIPQVDYDRIGERMHVELVYVNCDENADAAKFTALVEKAKGLGRTLILGCTDPRICTAKDQCSSKAFRLLYKCCEFCSICILIAVYIYKLYMHSLTDTVVINLWDLCKFSFYFFITHACAK